jgi:cellulose synthase/poly-beta-1,6-N-acetylglucosamine synthase-like glycosyltransferase
MKKKRIKNIPSKNGLAPDSLHDSAVIDFDYGQSIDCHDILKDDISDINRYLGHYNNSASKNFISITQYVIILSFIIAFSFLVIRIPEIIMPILLITGSILHFSLTTIKHFIFSLKKKIISLRDKYVHSIKELFKTSNNNVDYPIYSILLPVFMEEKSVLEQLFDAISNLDYPENRLQVLLILESTDYETIEHLKDINSELHYDLIIVPNFKPQTKAKACNYALNFIKGEYVVIFDADDIPAPDQLKLVVDKFRNNDKNLGCIQAKLNYYNADENILTRLFSLEYAILFDRLLPSLAQENYPLPLGGTSNHFRADVLKQLRGWDIYNLAEDAEIGMRLAIHGYRTETIDSYTAEESPVTIRAWLKQRSRWLKGFIQTYLLYLQRNKNLTDQIGSRKAFISMHFMLGISTLSLLITPLMLVFGISLIMGYTVINSELNKFILTFASLTTGLWIVSSLYQTVKTIESSIFLRQMSKMKKIILTLTYPIYFILHVMAALYAIFDLIRRPFYWSKTKHGVTKNTSVMKLFNRSR